MEIEKETVKKEKPKPAPQKEKGKKEEPHNKKYADPLTDGLPMDEVRQLTDVIQETEPKKRSIEVHYDHSSHPYVIVEERGKKRRVHPNLVDAKLKAKAMELVRGKFVYNDRKGGKLKFWWTPPFLGAQPREETFIDEEVREIPRALMEHINKYGKLPILQNVQVGPHRKGYKITSYKNRFDFYEMSGSIITAPSSERKLVEVDF